MATRTDNNSKNGKSKNGNSKNDPSFGDRLQELKDVTKDTASTALEQASSAAKDALETSRDTMVEKREEFAAVVRSSPLKSIAIATGVGLLLGAFWRK